MTVRFSFFLLLTTFLFFGTSCKRSGSSIHPEQKDITESVYASGMVKSASQYQVYAKVPGVIRQFFVKEGDVVKKGDPLFEIDNSNARLNTENARIAAHTADYTTNLDKLNDAQAAIDVAKRKLANDSSLFARQQVLWQQNVGTKNDLDQRELAYAASKSAFTNALVKYNDLKRQLQLNSTQSHNILQINESNEGDLIVRSDVAGKVYALNKEQGELVTSQMPVAVVGADGDYLLELAVDEHDILKVKAGQTALVRMDSYKSTVFESTVTCVYPMMDAGTRTFRVDAVFTSKPATLYPNLTAEANIVTDTRKGVLTIPRNCLVNDSTVLNDVGEKVHFVAGLMDLNLVEVRSGLTSASRLRLPKK